MFLIFVVGHFCYAHLKLEIGGVVGYVKTVSFGAHCVPDMVFA
jgi:hypothetical protein